MQTICHVSGLANALYIPYVIKYNSAVPETAIRYGAIAASLGLEPTVEALIGFVKGLNAYMGIPNTLADLGVLEDEFKEKVAAFSANAIEDACTPSNPRPIDAATMERLFTCVYYGTEVDF